MKNNTTQEIISVTPARLTSRNSEAFVVGCVDPRFANAVVEFITNRHPQQFDGFMNFPGGAKVLSEENQKQQIIFEDLQKAVVLHNIQHIYLFVHADCAMYKEIENEQEQQIQDLNTARTFLAQHFNNVQIHTMILTPTHNDKVEFQQVP